MMNLSHKVRVERKSFYSLPFPQAVVQFCCNVNLPEKLHLPLGQFTNLIAKFTSPGELDITLICTLKVQIAYFEFKYQLIINCYLNYLAPLKDILFPPTRKQGGEGNVLTWNP